MVSIPAHVQNFILILLEFYLSQICDFSFWVTDTSVVLTHKLKLASNEIFKQIEALVKCLRITILFIKLLTTNHSINC